MPFLDEISMERDRNTCLSITKNVQFVYVSIEKDT